MIITYGSIIPYSFTFVNRIFAHSAFSFQPLYPYVNFNFVVVVLSLNCILESIIRIIIIFMSIYIYIYIFICRYIIMYINDVDSNTHDIYRQSAALRLYIETLLSYTYHDLY